MRIRPAFSLVWLLIAPLGLIGMSCDSDSGGVLSQPRPRPAGPAAVSLVPDQTSYEVGDTITASVMITDAANVSSVPFHLNYDTGVLQFQPPAIEGGFLQRDGSSTVFLASEIPAGGEIVFGISRLGAGRGAWGEGRLVEVRFLAVGPGECGFRFSAAVVRDPQARTLPASFSAPPLQVVVP